jgi:hypothetical protein
MFDGRGWPMTSRDFCYWLQGFFELNEVSSELLTAHQLKVIKAHLAMVFLHEIDPSAGPPEHQAKLDAAHAAGEEPASRKELDVLKAQLEALMKRPARPLGTEVLRC